MKKISLALFIGLLMLSLVMVSAMAENTENAPVLGPGGENPNAESNTPILGPGGINKQEYPDTPIIGPDGINKQEYPDIIIDPAIHVYRYVRTNNGGHLNVRAWPDTNATILGKLNYGEQVLVTGFAENRTWAKILYNDSDAYVLARYLNPLLSALSDAGTVLSALSDTGTVCSGVSGDNDFPVERSVFHDGSDRESAVYG